MKSRSSQMKDKLNMLKRTNTIHIGGILKYDYDNICRTGSIEEFDKYDLLSDTLERNSFSQSVSTQFINDVMAAGTNLDSLKNLDYSLSNDMNSDSRTFSNHDGDAQEMSSDQADHMTDENSIRRGRRSAIIDQKNMIGESTIEEKDSSDPISKETKPDLSCKQSVGPVLNVKHNRILCKQHTIADLTARAYQNSTQPPYEDSKKRSARAFFKMRTKSKEGFPDLCLAMQNMKRSEFNDSLLASFKDKHWSDLDGYKKNRDIQLNEAELRRREAVWELFKSELVFLLDHIMVLKHSFMEPLKRLQVDGLLMFVEPSDLFCNLDDIAYVSYTFCKELISSLTKDIIANEEFGKTAVLVKPMINWSVNSKNGEVYHNYCLNYDCALTYLDVLRKYDEFVQFEKYCELDDRCRRLQLTDLLIAPMQHYTRLPLLLATIRKYTENPREKSALTDIIGNVEASLRILEDKMRWLKNFERLQEIQNQVIWPSIQDMDTRIFIPEFLKHSLAHQPCEKLIANPKRQLLYEGTLTLIDSGKNLEVYIFLFDDLLLVTKIKKPPKKKSLTDNGHGSKSPTEGGSFVVHRQPIALDRFTMHDIGLTEAIANGVKNAFVLVVISRFQQIINVLSFQASSESIKSAWMENLRQGQQIFQEKLRRKLDGRDLPLDLQTNKHSKLILNPQRSQKTSDENLSSVNWPKKLIQSPQLNSNIKRTQSVRNKNYCDDDIIEWKRSEALKHEAGSIFCVGSSFSPPLSPMLHQLRR